MQPQEAQFLLNYLLPSCEREFQTTRKVIAAIPEAKRDYRPEPRSRTAFELAWHIASSDVWFLEGIGRGEFGPEGEMPSEIRAVADVLAYYEKHFPAALAKVRSLTADKLAEPTVFFGVFDEPLITYLSFQISHTIHHRGQLAAYLRPMGSKVPNIYGGSADEPFEMAAQA